MGHEKVQTVSIPPAPGLRWFKVVYWFDSFPSSLGEEFAPPPTLSPGLWTPGSATPCYGLLRLFGHLGAFHFSIAFSMPLGIDF